MYTNVSFSDFHSAFDALRPENFSIDGLGILYDYLTDLEDSLSEPMELDVIAICCDYSEYSPTEFRKEYDSAQEVWEEAYTTDLISSLAAYLASSEEFKAAVRQASLVSSTNAVVSTFWAIPRHTAGAGELDGLGLSVAGIDALVESATDEDGELYMLVKDAAESDAPYNADVTPKDAWDKAIKEFIEIGYPSDAGLEADVNLLDWAEEQEWFVGSTGCSLVVNVNLL